MMELAQPLWLGLLPLPLAWLRWARRGAGADSGSGAAWLLRHPHLAEDVAESMAEATPGVRAPVWLSALAFVLLALALAQPREVGRWIVPPPQGRDIALVIDTSLTMSIDDFRLDGRPVARLDVLKSVLGEFIRGRAFDRFGIVALGSHAATLTPPTFDREHAIAQIARLQVGMAGDNTALGDALGLALKQVHAGRLRPAVILVSDGEPSNSGDMTPAEAVAVARQLGVAIHTVRIGADLFAAGRVAGAGVEEDADAQPELADIARLTGGHHWQVRGSEEVRAMVRDVGALEKTLARAAQSREVREWYWLPLALAALLLAAARALAIRG
jgi:Ca-activated chloride channel family protein